MATDTVRRSGILRLMKHIGPSNCERIYKAYQETGVSPEEILGTDNLIHIAEVAKTNRLAELTPGMVGSLIGVTSASQVPKKVAELASAFFVQAAEDIVSLFMRKLGE